MMLDKIRENYFALVFAFFMFIETIVFFNIFKWTLNSDLNIVVKIVMEFISVISALGGLAGFFFFVLIFFKLTNENERVNYEY